MKPDYARNRAILLALVSACESGDQEGARRAMVDVERVSRGQRQRPRRFFVASAVACLAAAVVYSLPV